MNSVKDLSTILTYREVLPTRKKNMENRSRFSWRPHGWLI